MSCERELVAQAAQGDETAVITLYEQHKTAVYTYVYYRVGGDQALAEDITAEVFMRMVERLPHFVYRERPFLAWLYTVARHRVADYYRRDGRFTEHGTRNTVHGSRLIDARIGAKGGPGEPEMIYFDDRRQLLSGQFAIRRLSQDVPDAAGLLVGDRLSIGDKGERPAVQCALKYAAGAHIFSLGDAAGAQR